MCRPNPVSFLAVLIGVPVLAWAAVWTAEQALAWHDLIGLAFRTWV